VRLRLQRREIILLTVLAVAGLVALWPQLRGSSDTPTRVSKERRRTTLPVVPRIDLDRIDEAPTDVEVGRRDLFTYGPLRRTAEVEPPASPPSAPAPRTEQPPGADPAARLAGGTSGSSLPPLNLKFIGSVGNERGVKVAVLVTERNEVLTGQAGEVIANRYRIERIGIESIDLEDVGTGQSRRIPLKGN
jgi:hypothetical protein